MANPGQSREGLVRPEVERTFGDVARVVLLRFHERVSWDRGNGRVVGGDARTVWAEGNEGGQLCLTQTAGMLNMRDLAGFQENSSLQSQPRMNHSTNRHGAPTMCPESWVLTSPLGASNAY